MKRLLPIAAAILGLLVMAGVGAGCASITPIYGRDGNIQRIESAKFLADLRYKRRVKYADDGKTIIEEEVEYATETNADKIIAAGNSLLGTLIDGAGKVMP